MPKITSIGIALAAVLAALFIDRASGGAVSSLGNRFAA